MSSSATAESSVLHGDNNKSNSIHKHNEETVKNKDNNRNENKEIYEFNVLLNSLAEQVSDPSHNPIAAAARVEDTWRKRSSQHDNFRKDVVSFNTVLKGWRNCCQCLAENKIQFDAHDLASLPIYTAYDAAGHALRLLQERRGSGGSGGDSNKSENNDCDPMSIDTTSYNIVMDAFVKSRNAHAVEHVASLFQQISGPSTGTVSGGGGGEESKSNENKQLKPDVVSWNTLLDAYAYSDRDDRLEMIEKLWKQMKKCTSGCRPTVRTINSILHAYSRPTSGSTSTTVLSGGRSSRGLPKTGNSNNNMNDNRVVGSFNQKEQWDRYATRCEAILQEMKDTYKETHNPTDQPDVMTYTNLMHMHSRRGTLEAAQRAEQLYQELKHLYDSTGNDRFQPSVYTYTVMILIWARTPVPGAPQKAEVWLQRLLADPNVKPNTKGFTACMQAWARSSDTARAAKVLQLLQQMKTNPYTKPNLVSYQIALDACCMGNATPHQQTAALKIAFAIFRAAEQDNNVIVNHSIYATLLKAVSVLLPPNAAAMERNEISTALFRKACKAGQVNASVIKALQQSVSTKVLKSLLEPSKMIGDHGEIRFDNIPTAWCKHVRI